MRASALRSILLDNKRAIPRGLKPNSYAHFGVTAEAVPFPNPFSTQLTSLTASPIAVSA